MFLSPMFLGCYQSLSVLMFAVSLLWQIFRPGDLLDEGRDFNSVLVTLQLLYNIAAGKFNGGRGTILPALYRGVKGY